jgi:hypothetical protein
MPDALHQAHKSGFTHPKSWISRFFAPTKRKNKNAGAWSGHHLSTDNGISGTDLMHLRTFSHH